jgi:hypothetical protein
MEVLVGILHRLQVVAESGLGGKSKIRGQPRRQRVQ